ncbi:hypothetical protein [Streptomyces sp. NPDC054797]
MTTTPEQTPAETPMAPTERAFADALLATAFSDSLAAPAAAAPSIPPGFRLTETTHADGSVTRTFEPVPTTPVEPLLPVAPASAPGRRLPAWTYSTRALKAYMYAGATGAVVTGAAIYGPAIGAGAAAAAAGVWAAVVTAAKVVGTIAFLLGLVYVLAPRKKKPRTGTFEGVLSGTWRQD